MNFKSTSQFINFLFEKIEKSDSNDWLNEYFKFDSPIPIRDLIKSKDEDYSSEEDKEDHDDRREYRFKHSTTSEIQTLINNNRQIKDKNINRSNLINGTNFVLVVNDNNLRDIKNQIQQQKVRGQFLDITDGISVRNILKNVIDSIPSQNLTNSVKWFNIVNYKRVKSQSGENVNTSFSQTDLVATKLGILNNGKTAIFLNYFKLKNMPELPKPKLQPQPQSKPKQEPVKLKK